jgi:hypothetical protein
MRYCAFGIAALLLALAAAPAAADAPDPLQTWTAAPRVAALIGACLKGQTNDENFSRRCTDHYTDACEKANNQTTAAMAMCTSAAWNYWKGVIAQRTRALLARHDPTLTKYLTSTAHDWEHYTTAKCSVFGLLQGTMWGPVSDACALDIALGRADDLQILAQNYVPDSDR